MALKLAKINIKKRKEAEQLVYDIFNILDPSGANTKKYKELFASMSDNEFIKTMNNMWEDDTFNFVLDIVDFERDIDLATVEKAAKKLGVPLEEDVIMPFLNMDTNQPVVRYLISDYLRNTSHHYYWLVHWLN